MARLQTWTWAMLVLLPLQSTMCNTTYDEQLSYRLLLHAASTFCADGDPLVDYANKLLPGFEVDASLHHEQTASRIVIGHGDGYVVFAARGTPLEDARAWLLDADVLLVDYPHTFPGYEHIRVHNGFLDCWEALASDALYALNSSITLAGGSSPRVWVTGHSLGAAVATLAALDLQRQLSVNVHLYTFGSPRVGNPEFAAIVNEQLSGRAFRVVHNHDVVSHLPPRSLKFYEHAQQEVWYDSVNMSSFTTCSGDEDSSCSDSIPVNKLTTKDHDSYFGINVGRICQNFTITTDAKPLTK